MYSWKYLCDSSRIAFNKAWPTVLLRTLWLVYLCKHCISFSPAFSADSESSCNFEWFHQKKVPNFEWFNTVALLRASPLPPSSLFFFLFFSQIGVILMYFFEFTLFTLFKFSAPGIHPNTSPVCPGAQIQNRARKILRQFFLWSFLFL